jgi:hypothetical protein
MHTTLDGLDSILIKSIVALKCCAYHDSYITDNTLFHKKCINTKYITKWLSKWSITFQTFKISERISAKLQANVLSHPSGDFKVIQTTKEVELRKQKIAKQFAAAIIYRNHGI